MFYKLDLLTLVKIDLTIVLLEDSSFLGCYVK